MAPILHILRHGQGFHSITENGHMLRDPELTPKGREQCAARCASFDRHDKVELLLASPLRRALQTCQLCFEPCVERGLKIVALPYAEEASDDPSDTGSDQAVLHKEFPNQVDFDHVSEGWYIHDGDYAITPKALHARATKLRRWIRDRPEKEVVLVAHGFFNHYITSDVDENGVQTTPWWRETEIRTFAFEEGDTEDARIVETAESLSMRKAEEAGLKSADEGRAEAPRTKKQAELAS
ncbi:hypothetical protein AMS68_005294 [Peltaster fructicola]|uniref:Phosphoglycerate mutase-like protein n=1 Tax=Peltaster fructicola TaxID=286661 RepID=A0A6H0XYC5_9PEZI|nr:hypothetical protein AMS68_005294 [Peltaster fructicola]